MSQSRFPIDVQKTSSRWESVQIMKKRYYRLGVFALQCLLTLGLGSLAGCRAAPIRMPCRLWNSRQTEIVEATPTEKTIQSSPLPSGEPLPAPPDPVFELDQSDSNRVPLSPAPMPDEPAQLPVPEDGTESIPRLEEQPQENEAEFPTFAPGANRGEPEKVPGKSIGKSSPYGHVPLTDLSDSAVELKPKPKASALFGNSPKVDPARGIRRTRFR